MPEHFGGVQWQPQPTVSKSHAFNIGQIWLGRSEDGTPIGYQNGRHVCIIGGDGGAERTSFVINNLCLWPGSAVVLDPTGESAGVTAAIRGQGSSLQKGMGQAVHVLDPFNASKVDEYYDSCYNPLDALDANDEGSIDKARHLADAMVVAEEASREPFWYDAARSMVRGLILHVATAPDYEGQRTLITVRDLIRNDVSRAAEGVENGIPNDAENQVSYLPLWRSMERNPAFDGTISRIGSQFRVLATDSPKVFSGVLQSVEMNTGFLDRPEMRRILARSDFVLSELKTRPEGMTVYLTLPQHHRETHYRWLRIMVALTTTEMEITRGKPATGHSVLMVLDEFLSLKRMEQIESGAFRLAGFGVKMFFVLRTLEQLKSTYQNRWEVLLANAGAIVFFGVQDKFTRQYASQLAGVTKLISASTVQSGQYSDSTSYSRTYGVSSQAEQDFPESREGQVAWSRGKTEGTTSTSSEGINSTESISFESGTSRTETVGSSSGASSSRSSYSQRESVRGIPLIPSHQVGKQYRQIEDKNDPLYPGLALVLMVGINPIEVRRTNYFDDPQFAEVWSSTSESNATAPPAKSVQIVGTGNIIVSGDVIIGDKKLIDQSEPDTDQNKCTFVRVFYVTDRKEFSLDGRLKFGSKRSDNGRLNYGECTVSIPMIHKVGKLESASILKLEFRPDPKKHIILEKVESHDEQVFFRKVSESVTRAPTKDAFVFVHGYNVSFEDAARRTGQIAFDLHFVGAPLFYSWPSNGKFPDYIKDETNVIWTAPHFERFLHLLARHSGARRIHIIAHSMGNRAVCDALKQIAAQPHGSLKFDHLVLAAPDIDAETFVELAEMLKRMAGRITLYESSKDKALRASKKIHGNPRAGEPLLVIPGLDTIDASAIDTDFLSHSYFSDNWPLLSDIHSILAFDKGPTERFGLSEMKAKQGKYFAFRSL